MNNIEREVISSLSGELIEQGLEVVVVNPSTATQLTPPIRQAKHLLSVLEVLDSCELHVYQHPAGEEYKHLGCVLIICDGRHGPDVLVSVAPPLFPHLLKTCEVSERLRAGATE